MIDKVRQLLADAAKASPKIETVLEAEDGRFEIDLSDDRTILAEFDARWGRLTLQTEIGLVPESRRLEVYEVLLGYNALWQETGGVTAALAGPDEPVLLMIAIFVFGFDADQIADLVANFAAKADVWQTFVTAKTSIVPENVFETEHFLKV